MMTIQSLHFFALIALCVHAKYGSHYSLHIPMMGTDMTCDCWSCDITCAASSPNLYRINLEQEVTSIEFDGDGGYLMAVGSSNGKVVKVPC